ncbi:hypothetical protein BOSE62_30312 [Bosea sp. 62]|nr:hypothetical protein BOSE46_130220 [Bosea sp. 46]CAD5267384.1 hypothetical protein BOSE21B_111308 [Bosea sp. 21B]CAD5271677.1 hypothetical protein BOSE7B_30086 [Bosea sp. 7B]VVT55914.1 hypothetical protein BOS5A_130020 [Bosea sp. EC-HK365B]VXB85805.1 hypothetical protein BOSE29B_130150 [Bosea sp. 29B]VXC17686.1 hypothetical protein BOSE62_30312 [Bosea sp. 62]VXC24579.1 hypothetical protein BOSE125_180275 [Bosea sp. 125]VXC68726.1 hypothetical protein BOSE127_40085 [Bosea sp. 127]
MRLSHWRSQGFCRCVRAVHVDSALVPEAMPLPQWGLGGGRGLSMPERRGKTGHTETEAWPRQ